MNGFRTLKHNVYVFICIFCSTATILGASEDSVEAVMEGYESPQKLFENLYKEQNGQNASKDSADTKNASIDTKTSSVATHPRDMRLPILPKWIYSTAIIEVSFSDGSFKRGLGTLLKNGFYITSAEIVYNTRKVVPNKIYAKMQDDFSSNVMCVASLSIKALDFDSGLALLKISQFVDSYCAPSAKSYYQDRIYKLFGIDVFASSAKIATHTKAYYPYLDQSYTFIPEYLRLKKFATYYDFERREELVYGFEIEQDGYEAFTYGKAFYDSKGIFLGIMSRVGDRYLPVFINRNVIQDFLCSMQDKEIIDDSFVQRSCQKLGTRRQRFFTHTRAIANFY